MADKNVQIKQRNETNDGWDNLYPKTKAELVETGGSTVAEHIADSAKHITGAERTAWQNKAEKTTATTAADGLMAKADKAKLDGIAAGANNYTHPTGDGNLHVAATGTTNNGKVLKAGATAGSISWGTLTATDVGAAPASHAHTKAEIEAVLTGVISFHSHASGTPTAHKDTHLTGGSDAIPVATASADGLMAKADKSKLDSVATGANNYTHPANHPASIITQDANNRFVTDTEKAGWNTKQKAITISNTAPVSPAAGELFFEILS
ncbi:hypothetical protein [Desulforamulus aeronauticus]|uniref:Phage tail fibre repeat-containing protein n=1 Tax=Desulforamulus aeronauticus DSM 10349 TaxID=1121421 RepID=A0A1M6WH85_9FIRM|nr:hypothetical protein [Desulforamulus aeronauticus]SHK93048.1 hypothetical protein SAMN02745123_03633 [Desulforamulus aeronauticus DSM 10349]